MDYRIHLYDAVSSVILALVKRYHPRQKNIIGNKQTPYDYGYSIDALLSAVAAFDYCQRKDETSWLAVGFAGIVFTPLVGFVVYCLFIQKGIYKASGNNVLNS